ncbi:MAG: hypothetical protein LBN26_10425 [Christensenellaceae bacterium]|jgi:hypothetical protein|nr:hypothetical protein [Christensenellaceae bacterium]
MKKTLAILLAMLIAATLFGCGTTTPPAAAPAPEAPAAAPEAPAAAPEAPAEEPAVVVNYAPYAIQFKNKTGVAITGLYLYATGAEDKGNSIVAGEWPDADVDKEASTIMTYLVRAIDTTYELYVEWVDGTSDTLKDITLVEYDKFSMKGGVDPAGWEHEALEDAEDIAEADAVIAAGRTADAFYGAYAVLGLEIKNKTGKDIAEFYLYEEGGDYTQYNNMVGSEILAFDEAEGTSELQALEAPWVTGKGGLYVFSYFIRPVADYYEVHLVFDDGTELTIPEIDLFTLNADGFAANEISMKSSDDPFGTVPAYDDGDPEPLQYIQEALKIAPAADGWYPTFAK